MSKFIVAVKDGPHGILVIVTDEDIFGKKFFQGNLQLNLTEKFYHGEEKDEAETISLMKSAYILHLTGEEAVKLGIKLDFVDPHKILRVQDVPHAEVVIEH